MKIKKNRIFWILIYGIFIISGTQILATYLYKEINEKTQKFIHEEIKNEKIIDFDTLHYTPGKGNYTEMILSNNKHFPIFVQNADTKSIKLNSQINKKAKSEDFEITNGIDKTKFTIQTAKEQQTFMRILFLFGTLAISISTFYKYGIEHRRK